VRAVGADELLQFSEQRHVRRISLRSASARLNSTLTT
jgi:hypothetical protein